MKNNTFTRSSRLSLKFVNKEKRQILNNILDEYKILTQKFINYFWVMKESDLPKFCDSKTYKIFDSDLGSYLRQSAGKQALGVIKGTFKKQKQRLYILRKLNTEGKFKQVRKLKNKIDEVNMNCPELKNIDIELGGNPTVVRLEEGKQSFDLVLYLSLTKEFSKKYIPLKKNKHFNRLVEKGGKIAKGCRISKDFVTLTFEFEKKEKEIGETLGVDIGSKNIISCSNSFQTTKGLDEIQKKLIRKKKGSKSYLRTQIERKNFINWSINQLDLSNIKTVKRENIKNLKKGVRTSKFLTAWTYTDIFDKLDRYCEEQNVSVIKISPTYTSQRCSQCGWTRKSNRKGKVFKCDKCGNTLDSDLNASKNISFNLREIGKKERLLQNNKPGFYWLEEGQELIVPDVERNKK